VIYIGSTFS